MKRYMILLLLLSAYLSATYTQEQVKKMIGKMIIYGFYGTKINSDDKLYKDIKRYDLGGVILFDTSPKDKRKFKNIKSPSQVQKLTSQLQNIKDTKLLIAIDQEGGYVQRLRKKRGFIETKSAKYISSQDTNYAKKEYKNLAYNLNKNGINLNFAPVVDLALNPKNKVIYKLNRSYGKDVKDVIKYSSIFIEQLKKKKIISVLKHFPGHGSSLKDSHKGFVDITNTWQKKELEPYKYFIKNDDVDMIMSAHVYNKNLDENYPATLSYKINTKLLRDKLKFKGVLISDDLQMHAISKHYTLKQTVTLAINSGVNMLLFANQLAKPLSLDVIIDTIYKQIKEGNIALEKIIQSNKKIDNLLKKY